ncbi:MAG: sensor histidine kinase [Cyclobacteriaceae bacterium]
MTEIINDIGNISHDLAPTIAHVSGLMPLVEKLIANTRKESGIDVKLQVFDFKEVLKTGPIIQLYRILQEALNNIVKHAEATEVDIQLFGHKGELNITIEDNGKGFDISQLSEGLGQSQMKIRTEGIEINSHVRTGTLILLEILLH